MARGRFITNEIARDKAVNDLSDDTSRLAFTWLITFADAEGRTYGDPAIILSMLFPRRRDVSIERMEGYIKEWQAAGLVRWYEAKGDWWIEFPTFEKHQTGLRKDREAPSTIPPSAGVAPSSNTNTPDKIQINSGVALAKIGLIKRLIKGEVEVEVKGNGTAAPAAFEIPNVSEFADDRKAEALFCRVTNFVSIPPGEIKRLDQLIGFIRAYGEQTAENALSAAYQTWTATKRKDGSRTYRGTNCGWVDWAQDALAGNGAAEKDPMQMTHAEFIAYYEAKAREDAT